MKLSDGETVSWKIVSVIVFVLVIVVPILMWMLDLPI